MKNVKTIIASAFIMSLNLLSLSAAAVQNTQQATENSFAAWTPVADSSLDVMRGGFVLNNGVVVDISFQKNIFRNGELISNSYFQSPQNTNLLSKDEFNLNSIVPNSTLNTLLQNTIDNQTLSTITNIDITITNLELAKQAFIQDEIYNIYFGAGNF